MFTRKKKTKKFQEEVFIHKQKASGYLIKIKKLLCSSFKNTFNHRTAPYHSIVLLEQHFIIHLRDMQNNLSPLLTCGYWLLVYFHLWYALDKLLQFPNSFGGVPFLILCHHRFCMAREPGADSREVAISDLGKESLRGWQVDSFSLLEGRVVRGAGLWGGWRKLFPW